LARRSEKSRKLRYRDCVALDCFLGSTRVLALPRGRVPSGAQRGQKIETVEKRGVVSAA
jgi:hypothetical protein